MNIAAHVSIDSPTLDPARPILDKLSSYGVRLQVRVQFGGTDSRGKLTRRGYIASVHLCGRHLSTPVCCDASEAVETWWQMHGHALPAVAA